MTVRELKALLDAFNEDLDVWVTETYTDWRGEEIMVSSSPAVLKGFLNDQGDDFLKVDEDGESGYDECIIIHFTAKTMKGHPRMLESE